MTARLATNLLLAAIFVTGLTISAATANEPTAPDWVVQGPSDADKTAAMMRTHHCWSGEGPQGVIPGHAVVDLGAGPEYVSSDVGFAIWLDGKPGRLFGFCR